MNDVRRALAEAAARDVPAGSVDLWPAIRAAVAPRVPEPQDRAPRSWQGRLRGVAEVVWVAALCVGIALAVRAMVGTEGAPAPSPTAALPAGASHGTPEATPEAAPTALPTPTAAPEGRTPAPEGTYEARPTERHQGRLRFLLSANPSDPALTDIEVTDLVTGEALGAWSVPDVNVTHYHNVEYHGGRLYVLKRLGYDGYPDEDWTDELWRYDRDGQGDLLYRLQGLDFRVSPDERWIAVRDHERALVILDGQGHVTAERDVLELAGDRMARDFYRTLDPSPFYRPAGWSADGEHLWLEFHPGVQLIGFLRLSAGDWHVEHYDVSGLGAGFESALEPTTGRLAYSDMPAILDEFSHEEFVASRRPVTLYVLDLETGQSDVVAVSEARRFLPRWLDEETLDYYDPADTSDDPARITTVVPEVTAEGRAILYIRDDDLWRADLDGSRVEAITTGGALNWQVPGVDWLQILIRFRPQVSPDGRWVSYAPAESPGYIEPAPGEVQPRPAEAPQVVLQPVGHDDRSRGLVGARDVAWAPDSQRVAYVVEPDAAWNWEQGVTSTLHIYDLATGEAITPLAGRDIEHEVRLAPLLWSPDGSALAFACCMEEIREEGVYTGRVVYQVHRLDLATGEVEPAGTLEAGVATIDPLCWVTRDTLNTEVDDAEGNRYRVCVGSPPFCGGGTCVHPVSGRTAVMEYEPTEPERGALRLSVTKSDDQTFWERDLEGTGLNRVHWSPDGRWLLLDDERPDTPIWRLAADGSGELEPILEDAILVRATPRW